MVARANAGDPRHSEPHRLRIKECTCIGAQAHGEPLAQRGGREVVQYYVLLYRARERKNRSQERRARERDGHIPDRDLHVRVLHRRPAVQEEAVDVRREDLLQRGVVWVRFSFFRGVYSGRCTGTGFHTIRCRRQEQQGNSNRGTQTGGTRWEPILCLPIERASDGRRPHRDAGDVVSLASLVGGGGPGQERKLTSTPKLLPKSGRRSSTAIKNTFFLPAPVTAPQDAATRRQRHVECHLAMAIRCKTQGCGSVVCTY